MTLGTRLAFAKHCQIAKYEIYRRTIRPIGYSSPIAIDCISTRWAFNNPSVFLMGKQRLFLKFRVLQCNVSSKMLRKISVAEPSKRKFVQKVEVDSTSTLNLTQNCNPRKGVIH